MYAWCRILAACTAVVAPALGAVALDDPWADEVLDYSPVSPPLGYDDPAAALGPPSGGGTVTPDNSSTVSLGRQGGSITLRFATPVLDDPQNPMGLDCIVFSNAFWVGGNPQRTYQEPALIEISRDVNGNGLADDPWYLIPGSRNLAYDPFPWVSEPLGDSNTPPASAYLLAGHIQNPNVLDGDPGNDSAEYNWGYAELTPALQPHLDNYLRPDDPFAVGMTEGSGGGDAFDIAWAVDAQGDPADLDRFDFIRLTAFIDRRLGPLGYASPEIDAVADVAALVDSDNDGILDDYELRVAGTDPARPESTVLPLEIPPEWGGSPAGTLLGTAADGRGNRIRLLSAGLRSDTGRAFNATVDLLPGVDPGMPLPNPELLKSGAVLVFESSIPGFPAAGIQPAELTIAYTAEQIVGLDEAALHPYRAAPGGYTLAGIADVQRVTAANHVVFRTDVPGVFLLAAPAGEGEPGGGNGPLPAGAIALAAAPSDAQTADPTLTVFVTGGPVLDGHGALVPDGTMVTVDVNRGTILSPDASDEPGIQAETQNGDFQYLVAPAPEAGAVRFSAASVEGSAFGELDYLYLPGTPAQLDAIKAGAASDTWPTQIPIAAGPIRDAHGNVVAHGTLVTFELSLGTFASADAEPETPGHQATVQAGYATVLTGHTSPATSFVVRVFGASGLLGEAEFTTPDIDEPSPDDVNGDGIVNALDVQLVINASLGIDVRPAEPDVNGDGRVDAVDVQRVVNAALGLAGAVRS